MKLFAVLLGGRADGCNIELHDVVFAVGETFADTHAQLANKWFGNKKRLHIDSTVELNQVDGYDIALSAEKPANQDLKLFFVNFGAYKQGMFLEVHERHFYVAANKPDVLARAKRDLCVGLLEPHCDDNVLIDDVMAIESVDHYYLHFSPTMQVQPLKIESYFRKLSLPA